MITSTKVEEYDVDVSGVESVASVVADRVRLGGWREACTRMVFTMDGQFDIDAQGAETGIKDGEKCARGANALGCSFTDEAGLSLA